MVGKSTSILQPPQDDWSASPRSCRSLQTSLSEEVVSSIEDRTRIWEVRKYCQVKPSLAQYDRSNASSPGTFKTEDSKFHADAALSALLGCLLYELDGDIAMISLLDDQSQYFLAGASRENLADGKPTVESTKWYGCDFVLHHGGLCERTVTLRDLPAIYEELDLTANEATSRLPFVDGSIASYRHYAGSPISTEEGVVIGTVFVFFNKSSDGLRQSQRQLLVDTSENIMKQLVQAVRALEGTRSTLFNSAVAGLLKTATSCMREFDQNPHAGDPALKEHHARQSRFVAKVYQQAAKLLSDAFELDHCQFQELALSGNERSGRKTESFHLGHFHRSDRRFRTSVPENTAQHLAKRFPNGAILHLSKSSEGGGVFMTSHGTESSILGNDAYRELHDAFPQAQQILFMPLWDMVHNRTVATAFGWSSTFDRVYSCGADLSQLSAFGTCLMAQVRRMELHVLDQTKADFLGSISHEMRSPLHGILGSLEMLLGTQCDEEQLDLLHSARIGGFQLLGTYGTKHILSMSAAHFANVTLDNINKILAFTKISSLAQNAESRPTGHVQGASSQNSEVDSGTDLSDDVVLLKHCEELVSDILRRSQDMGLINTTPAPDQNPSKIHPVLLTLDASQVSSVHVCNYEAFDIIIDNLLTNALKYSGTDCCLRMHLSIDSETLDVSIMDCGKGMSTEFTKNLLYVPFSQANPVDAGTGLGLSLVKRTIDALGGTIDIESQEAVGTTVRFTIPLGSLDRVYSGDWADVNGQQHTKTLPSPLRAQLFVPPSWLTAAAGEKGERRTDNLLDSLTHSLDSVTSTELHKWSPGSELPDLIFIRQGDLPEFTASCGDEYSSVRKVYIGREATSTKPPVSALQSFDHSSGPIVEVRGPLLPSRLREALDKLYVAVDTAEELVDDTSRLSIDGTSADTPTAQHTDEVTDAAPQGKDNESEHITAVFSNEQARDALPPASKSPTAEESSRKPRLLLVDDNAINLKLLRMFALKAGVQDLVSARGGGEAIRAYEKALEDNNGFSICFMDLSMPDVDGFQATAEIRRREAESSAESKMEIVALTGLVSGKDRAAAMTAGVDGYITKPAKVKDIQEVIDGWKATDGGNGANTR